MAREQRSVAVFGATGSIGGNTLDLIRGAPERFRVSVLTAGDNVDLLVRLAREFKPSHIGINNQSKLPALREALGGEQIEIHGGEDALANLGDIDADITVVAITGMAGLMPMLKAASRRGVVAIANKEAIVAAGVLIQAAAEASGAVLLPIDSEHNAIAQILADRHYNLAHIDSVTLTASGGALRDWSLDDMRTATPEQACHHPNWSMGAKISVDSATLMNKGLEVIEAGVLFNLPEEKINVVIHRQSFIHAMVSYKDGSILAQMGDADMRVPISYALGWPERLDWQPTPVNPTQFETLTFEEPDLERFPCLDLARQVMRAGGLAPAALNAANEVAVAAFLSGGIGFLDIATLNRHIVDSMEHPPLNGLDSVMQHDRQARDIAAQWLAQKGLTQNGPT